MEDLKFAEKPIFIKTWLSTNKAGWWIKIYEPDGGDVMWECGAPDGSFYAGDWSDNFECAKRGATESLGELGKGFYEYKIIDEELTKT